MTSTYVSDSSETLAAAAAKFIGSLAIDTIRRRGRFSIALSGGNTPKLTFEHMRSLKHQPDWESMYFFWSDERCVPPNHPDSNYRMAHEALLAHVPVPAGNIQRMDCSHSPQAGAKTYEALLRDWEQTYGEPVFDLVMLGLGSDGHTASLFPGSQAIEERERWVVANRVDRLGAWRMTLTYPGLSTAGHILFLVQGADKAAVVKAVLEESRPDLPATAVRSHSGSPVWFLDASAAAQLDSGSPRQRRG
jgi:6-phosphogluconolactonase